MSGRSFNNRPKCNFCLKNGERQDVVFSHATKDRTGKVTCPFLMKYVCPYCNATGAQAHTQSYCPMRGNYQSLSKYRFPKQNGSNNK